MAIVDIAKLAPQLRDVPVWVPYAVALLLALSYLFYHLVKAGLFRKTEIRTTVLGPYLVVYKTVVGPYGSTPEHCNDLADKVLKMGLVHKSEHGRQTGMGLFYDDPRTTEPSKCRFVVGWVFKQGADIAKAEDLEKHRAWLSGLSAVQNGSLKVGVFPASRCLMVQSPMLGRLSVVLAVLRSYPALRRAFDKLQRESKGSKAVPAELQGALEVYLPIERVMYIAFPLTPRDDMLPFTPPHIEAAFSSAPTDNTTADANGKVKTQ